MIDGRNCAVRVGEKAILFCVFIFAMLIVQCDIVAQSVNVDSFYRSLKNPGDLEATRKQFYELRKVYFYDKKMPPDEWARELENIFNDDQFSNTIFQLISGDLLGTVYHNTESNMLAAAVHLKSARLYESSGLGTAGNIAIHYSQASRNFLFAGVLDSSSYFIEKAHVLNSEHDLKLWEVSLNRSALFRELGNWEKFDEAWTEGYEYIQVDDRPGQKGYFLYLACQAYYELGVSPDRLNFFLNKLDEYQAGKPLATPASHYPLLDFLYAPQIDSTITKLKNALDFNRGQKNDLGTNVLSRSLAKAYSDKGEYLKSIEVLNAQIELLVDTIFPYDGQLLYGDLERYYQKIGDTEMAYHSLSKAIEYKSSFTQQKLKESATEAQVKYDTERKEKELAQRNEQLSKSKQQRNLLVVGGLGLLIAAGLLYRLARTRKINNLVLVEKNALISKANSEKDNLLKEIHHRVKNNLQIVSSLLSLQSSSSDDADAKAAIDDGRNRVQSMAFIHQNLFIDDDRMQVNTRNYIPKLVQYIYDSYAPIAKGIELDVKVDSVDMEVDTVVPIGLIINELVTNAMKYAYVNRDNGMLSVSLKNNENAYDIEVMDDGIGIEQSQKISKRVGIGSQLIKSFCDKLDAQYLLESTNGTKVNIIIPKS